MIFHVKLYFTDNIANESTSLNLPGRGVVRQGERGGGLSSLAVYPNLLTLSGR